MPTPVAPRHRRRSNMPIPASRRAFVRLVLNFVLVAGAVAASAQPWTPDTGNGTSTTSNVGIGAVPNAIPFYLKKTGLNVFTGTQAGVSHSIFYNARANDTTESKGVTLGYDDVSGAGVVLPVGTGALAFWLNGGGSYGERMLLG